MKLDGKTVLVTGATGTFGTQFIRTVLERHDVKAIRAFSRDELKQHNLSRAVEDERVRFLLGDVRDLERLRLATRGVDLIVHAAALKQVPACEYNPFEAIQTNVVGTQNVATAAIENRVPLTIGISSDKAVNPTNLYGSTKLCAERVLAQAGVYAGDGVSAFGAVRYGNVVGSRGSVIPIFQAQAKTGLLTITDERMTRFWLTIEQAVDFVLDSLPLIKDGEVHVPKLPSARILDFAQTIAPDAQIFKTGVRPGEKLHECLLTEDEARHAHEAEGRYVIRPFRLGTPLGPCETLPDGFRYTSDGNPTWLSPADIAALAGIGVMA